MPKKQLPKYPDNHPQNIDVRVVEIVDISPGTNLRFRNSRAEADMPALVESIKTHGILTALLLNETKPGEYECVCGHRRLAAAAQAGLHDVPAVVRKMTPDEIMEAQLDENGHRDGLDPIDEGKAFQNLLAKYGSIRELATRVGRSVAYVQGRISLQSLPPAVQDRISSDSVSLTVGMLIAKMPSDRRESALQRLGDDGTFSHDVSFWRSWANSDTCPMLCDAQFDSAECAACNARGGGEFFDCGLDDRCYDAYCWKAKTSKEYERRAGAPNALVLALDTTGYYDLDSCAAGVYRYSWAAGNKAGLSDSSIRDVLLAAGANVSKAYAEKAGIWHELARCEEVEAAFELGGFCIPAEWAKPRKSQADTNDASAPQSETPATLGPVPFSDEFRDACERLEKYYRNRGPLENVKSAIKLVRGFIGCADSLRLLDEQFPDPELTAPESAEAGLVKLMLMLHDVAEMTDPMVEDVPDAR